MAKRILMVLTSHDLMGVSGKKTGNWFDEVATPYYMFAERGFETVMASPRGGAAPIDPLSHHAAFTTPHTERFDKDPAAQRALANTLELSAVNHRDFDAAFFPGGYGQLWDLASNSLAIKVVEDTVASEKPVAMVCHGPAILRDARQPNGEPLVKGRNVTGFTDDEDRELNLTRHLLFSVEKMLVANGGHYSRSDANWKVKVVEDGILITGQNPASAGPVAERLANRLG